ncbi:MAG: EAL domain-containing protein [Acidobacteriota bacterium]
MGTTMRGWIHKATEPQILFPAMGVLILAVLWGATWNLIQIERAAAEHAAAVSSAELLDTYEAQVVRAVREIDLTLKSVKFAFEKNPKPGTLGELGARGLLPPDLLFAVSIADRNGAVVASTRPLGVKNVADREYFQAQRTGDDLSVSLPRQDPDSGEWTLRFSRRLNSAGRAFNGVVMVSVGADYFMSGYDPVKLGDRGVLGLLGTDGVFRARRTGDVLSYGDSVDYATAIGPAGQDEMHSYLGANPWDGVQRFTSARGLFDLPLAVVVGLSREEQLAPVAASARQYVRRAAAGSVGIILIVGLLGRMSWRLAKTRREVVEAQIEHSERVEYLAYHDGLTGLPNRSLFTKLLQQALAQARRNDRRVSVLFLDLDRFKHINDTLGHEAGDQLLQEVARRLKACLRESDTVARLGGDEFVVMVPDLTNESYVAGVAQKIVSAIAKPFILLKQEFRVTGSVGISTHPQDGLDEQTLTKNADIAMYKAKEQGKNTFQFYSEQLNVDTLERLTLETSLRHAAERNQFELHYQAKRDIQTGRITGMEALLRWRHPDLGIVAPMKFIPLAEQTGLIVPIGRWVLRAACMQNVAWQKEGLPRLTMAVNLTQRQFADPHLLVDIASILESTGMGPGYLELEISESMLMQNVGLTLQVLSGLKAMGVRIAVDDFGLGYSTLATLQQFPLDTIKIDRSLIRAVAHAPDDKEITGAIIAMGRALSMTVVAQGVETKEQADFLRDHACDELQGFYFNRPVPAAGFGDLLRAESALGVRTLAAHTAKRSA